MAIIPLCCEEDINDTKQNRRCSLRTKLLLFWIEFLGVSSVLIAYFITAFVTGRKDIGDEIIRIVRKAESETIGACIAGGVFWGLLYIISAIASIGFRADG